MGIRTAVAMAALAFTTARAADAPSSPAPPDRPGFEVTAFPGFSFGGSLMRSDTGQGVDVRSHGSFALALDMEADDMSQYELFYSRQSTVMRGDPTFSPTDVSVEYLHVGGTLVLDQTPRVEPYLLGTLGVTRFSPPAPGLDNTRFSISLGLGLRVPLSRRLQARLEARGFLTLVSSDTSFFCRSDQTGLLCEIHGHGSTFLQGQALAGVAFSF